MESERLSQLIGLIYDSALDLDLWPLLLQGLAQEIDACVNDESRKLLLSSSGDSVSEYISHWYELQDDEYVEDGDKIRYFSRSEGELFGLILPHLRRAIKINHDLVSLNIENQAYASVLERLPIGMVVVDHKARVYAKNHRFNSLLEMQQGLRIQKGALHALSRADTETVRELIGDVCSSGEADHLGRAMRLEGATPVSLLILPLIQDEQCSSNTRAIIFVAGIASDINIEAETLKHMYGLSPAESRLTISLVKGASLDETAKRFNVSSHTIRTQLKSIYAKTNCRRQAELMVKVLTSPAILSIQKEVSEMAISPMQENILHQKDRLTQSIFLQDGRRLCYAEYGPKNGTPVVLMHSASGSRLQVPDDEDILHEYGVRILAPDRPGIGLSDIKKKHTIIGIFLNPICNLQM